jgi:four helix bundle protein
LKFERFEDIEAWKKARALASDIYRITSGGEMARDYGLRDQLRRASVSILLNIAEGFERGGNKEFYQFLALAKGSCGEVRAQLYVALDQRYVSNQQFNDISGRALEVSRMISGLMKYLKQSEMRGSKYKAEEFED